MIVMLCRIHVAKKLDANPTLPFVFDGVDYSPEMSPQELLRRAVLSRPRFISKKNSEWSIGNIEQVDEKSLLFMMGREKLEKQGAMDEKGDFLDETRQIAPHTTILLDWDLEVCAIEPESKLGSQERLPLSLENLLNNSEVAKLAGVAFSVRIIDDPDDFIDWLSSAYKITYYRF